VTFLDLSFGFRGSSTIGNTHLYTGRERDPETGLQLNRHRYYAAHLGRWVNRDPIGYEGGMNLYGYVGGMPTFYVDPSGELEYPATYPPPGGARRDEPFTHLRRNVRNQCPNKEPKCGTDSLDRKWKRDDRRGEVRYHCGHRCYRSGHFQCCYDSDGDPVRTGNCQGTYDKVAYDPETGEGWWGHYWNDVWPHSSDDDYGDHTWWY
jgi:RHS repeat-associated protein